MRRILFALTSAVSLLVLMATLVLWVRSHWLRDESFWVWPAAPSAADPDGEPAFSRYIAAESDDGRFLLMYETLVRTVPTAPRHLPPEFTWSRTAPAGPQALAGDRFPAVRAWSAVGVRTGWADYMTGGVHRRRGMVVVPY